MKREKNDRFWNIPVDPTLNKQADDAAIKLHISKASFIKIAVAEKIERLKK